jgi:HEAT repeat protein
MSQISEWLSGGDLRSDGRSPEIARVVLKDHPLLAELFDCLESTDDVVRGRAADALERISRSQPGWLLEQTPRLLSLAQSDPVPMVRWHLAMIFGNLALFPEWCDSLVRTLVEMLDDASVFVRSWAIVSLCVMARRYPEKGAQITDRVAPLLGDKSIAVRSRAKKALGLLINPATPFPPGWLKSPHLKDLSKNPR